MAKVVHFEITAQDVARALSFYREVLGWQITKWEGSVEYWLVSTGDESEPGINGAITPSRENWPNTVNTIDVTDLDATLNAVAANGGSIVMPRMAVPGVGYMAYCQDTEGTIFGVMESDESAA